VPPLPVSVPLITNMTNRKSWALLMKCEQGVEGTRENNGHLCDVSSMVCLPLNTIQCSSAPLMNVMSRYKVFPPKSTYWFASLKNLSKAGEFLFHLYKGIKRVIFTKSQPIASLQIASVRIQGRALTLKYYILFGLRLSWK